MVVISLITYLPHLVSVVFGLPHARFEFDLQKGLIVTLASFGKPAILCILTNWNEAFLGFTNENEKKVV